MKANEILKAAEMFARVKNLIEATRVYNVLQHPDEDYLFVFCRKNGYYTNSFCDIMENHDINREDYYSLKTIDDTAAKFVELALASGADSVDDFYLSC